MNNTYYIKLLIQARTAEIRMLGGIVVELVSRKKMKQKRYAFLQVYLMITRRSACRTVDVINTISKNELSYKQLIFVINAKRF